MSWPVPEMSEPPPQSQAQAQEQAQTQEPQPEETFLSEITTQSTREDAIHTFKQSVQEIQREKDATTIGIPSRLFSHFHLLLREDQEELWSLFLGKHTGSLSRREFDVRYALVLDQLSRNEQLCLEYSHSLLTDNKDMERPK